MFVKLCDKTILPIGEIRSFKIKDHEILAVNVDGKIFCLDGRCTHAGAPLAEGTLRERYSLVHGTYSQFNITSGLVIRGPAYKPLKSYLVEEKENSVFIDL